MAGSNPVVRPDDRRIVANTRLTPEQRRTRARIGAYALHAQGGTNTGPATAAMLSRFDDEVKRAAAANGDTLTDEEFARRVKSARRAHFQSLALASSRSRRRRSNRHHPHCPDCGNDIMHSLDCPRVM